MTIKGLDRETFAATLHAHLSPSSPIQSLEHLHGREQQLRVIDQALFAKGRHVFIYGDRGVGKTSLAQTAAFSHQSSDREPIIVTCGRDVTFFRLIRSIVEKLLGQGLQRNESTTTKRGFSLAGLTLEQNKVAGSIQIPELDDMNRSVYLVREIGLRYSQKTLVVVDEFDLITDAKQKELFADFIKQLGDQQVPVQFIFCGIGESLDLLLGAHGSCFRYLEGIEVPRLYFGARYSIIDESATALGVTVNDEQRFRISAISDGFPYYVHLICEKLYWELFNMPTLCAMVTPAIYAAAIRAAINGIQQELRRAYDKATLGKADEYEPILWAAADHSNLTRRLDQVYSSYCSIAERLGDPPITQDLFRKRLGSLRGKACGRTLFAPRRGWSQFRESMLRGYVRLRAEAEGVMIATDYGEIPEERITARGRRQQRPLRGWRRQVLRNGESHTTDGES